MATDLFNMWVYIKIWLLRIISGKLHHTRRIYSLLMLTTIIPYSYFERVILFQPKQGFPCNLMARIGFSYLYLYWGVFEVNCIWPWLSAWVAGSSLWMKTLNLCSSLAMAKTVSCGQAYGKWAYHMNLKIWFFE